MVWKVMHSLYLKHYMGYIQVANGSMKFHGHALLEGFTSCKADSDVWMQHNGDTYEHVAIYVDDLLCTMRDPRSFLNCLIQVHKYKLKLSFFT